jgi:hypothetical protein
MDWKGVWSMVQFVDSLAQVSYGVVLESRHLRTMGATTCLVWNSLLTN